MPHLLLSFNSHISHTYAVFWSIVHLYDHLQMCKKGYSIVRKSTAPRYEVYFNNYSDFSYAERCIQLSILPLCFRREINDLLLFFKYLNSYVDCNFSSYFKLVGSLQSLRSSSNGKLLKLPTATALQASYFIA